MHHESTIPPEHFPSLPKWPAIVVRGKSVTQDQAYEIILRTSGSLDFSCNDKPWEYQLANELGVPFKGEDTDHRERWRLLDELAETYGILSLEYLTNSRIASAYIGGPGGWMGWDGKVQLADRNIGKWPSGEQVLQEWELIARTWPFLTLRCQLWSKESGEEDGIALIEYVVENGNVSWTPHPKNLLHPWAPDIHMNLMNMLHNPTRERGCSIEQFRKALSLAKASVSCPPK